MVDANSLTRHEISLNAVRVPIIRLQTLTQSMGLDPRDLEITDLEKGTLASLWDVWNPLVIERFDACLCYTSAGFLDLLSQLTSVGDVTPQAFQGSQTRAHNCNPPEYINL